MNKPISVHAMSEERTMLLYLGTRPNIAIVKMTDVSK